MIETDEDSIERKTIGRNLTSLVSLSWLFMRS